MKYPNLKRDLFLFLLIVGTNKISAQSAPTVTTGSVANITATTASILGDVTNDGNDTNTLAGFCYNIFPYPSVADSVVTVGYGSTGSFGDTIYGLYPNTTYYIKAFAINATGTSYGSQVTFTTGSAVLPTVTTDSVINITATTAYGFGNVTNDGNDPYLLAGFCYNTSPNPTIADSVLPIGYGGTGSFSDSIFNLKPNTTYYLKAYSTNAAGTTYGSQNTFTTGSATLATITTDSVINISATTAYSFGNVTNDGNDPRTLAGFCYNTSPNPTIVDSVVHVGYGGTGSFWDTVYNLIPNTTYYIKAYSTNAAGTSYGSQLTFTTGTAILPTVTTDSVINITGTTAYGFGNVTNDGNDPSTLAGFCYNTSPNPTIADSTVSVGYGGKGSYWDTIYNLIPNTTYYLKAYSTNAGGTSYGSQITFTTGTVTLPTVTTDSVHNISATTAYGFGTVTDDGNDASTLAGFCYNTSSNPTIADIVLPVGYGSTGSYSDTIYNLLPNTTYYIRAYSTNTAGTSYGSQIIYRSCTYLRSTQIDTVCKGHGLTVGGNTHTVSGAYIDTLSQKVGGCDSIVTTYLTVLNIVGCVTSITEYNLPSINVYPNPTSGIINLNIGQLQNAQVSVYDMYGEIIYQHTITSSIFQIDLSVQPNGIYFIKLITEQGIVNKKVVISH